MAYQNILLEREGQIAILTINRPDKLNALNYDTLTEIQDVINSLRDDDSLRGLIITGAGHKAFVAGADISEFKDLDVEQAKALAKRGHDIYDSIERMKVPVIAAVNGFALGGGCELAMSCHIRVGSEKAKLGLPEAGLGIIPGYGGTQRLIRYIGKGKAMELMMTTDMIGAEEAHGLGLLNHVVDPSLLLEKCKDILKKTSSKGPVAIQKIIECSNAYFDKNENGFGTEIDSFGALFLTEDVKEGTNAFLEKRKANFTGR